VISEFAVALALLAGAGFMIQAFDSFMKIDPGYEVDGLLTFQISVPEDRYADDEAVATYQDELLRSLEGVPGVSGVALMSALPRGYASSRTPYEVDGRPVPDDGERPTADFQVVNPRYFETMGIEVLQGRPVDPSDRAEAQPVAWISRALAEREFPGEDPLGRGLVIQEETRIIAGVVETVQQQRISLAGESGQAIYLPYPQRPGRNLSFAVRTESGDPSALAGDVRQAVWAVNPDQPVAGLRTLQDYIDESLSGPRAISVFLTVMGVIALLLAAMGIYGVMAHSVTQQRREIGIRMALGADRGSVVGMVTRSGLTLAGIGMVLGMPLAWLMFRAFTSAVDIFAEDVGFGYAAILTGALLAVAALSTWLPARRASGVSPVGALREE
jgi:putative ABC transport system permease protein